MRAGASSMSADALNHLMKFSPAGKSWLLLPFSTMTRMSGRRQCAAAHASQKGGDSTLWSRIYACLHR